MIRLYQVEVVPLAVYVDKHSLRGQTIEKVDIHSLHWHSLNSDSLYMYIAAVGRPTIITHSNTHYLIIRRYSNIVIEVVFCLFTPNNLPLISSLLCLLLEVVIGLHGNQEVCYQSGPPAYMSK